MASLTGIAPTKVALFRWVAKKKALLTSREGTISTHYYTRARTRTSLEGGVSAPGRYALKTSDTSKAVATATAKVGTPTAVPVANTKAIIITKPTRIRQEQSDVFQIGTQVGAHHTFFM